MRRTCKSYTCPDCVGVRYPYRFSGMGAYKSHRRHKHGDPHPVKVIHQEQTWETKIAGLPSA